MSLWNLAFQKIGYISYLKTFKKRPYRVNLVNYLRQSDFNRSLTFIAWIILQIHDDSLFLNYILWTDESKFTQNSILNK